MVEQIGLVLALLVLTMGTWWAWRRRRKLAQGAPTCANCRSFSLEGGQQTIAHTGAFAAAAAVLPPWKMAVKRQIEWSPEYRQLEAELAAAVEDDDVALQGEINAKIHALGELGTEVPPAEYVAAELLELSWRDFGACTKHGELRARTDSCDQHTFDTRPNPKSHLRVVS